jgi:hypothetical protein
MRMEAQKHVFIKKQGENRKAGIITEDNEDDGGVGGWRKRSLMGKEERGR